MDQKDEIYREKCQELEEAQNQIRLVRLECDRRIAEYQKNVETDLIDWGPMAGPIMDQENKRMSLDSNNNNNKNSYQESPLKHTPYKMQQEKLKLLENCNQIFLQEKAKSEMENQLLKDEVEKKNSMIHELMKQLKRDTKRYTEMKSRINPEALTALNTAGNTVNTVNTGNTNSDYTKEPVFDRLTNPNNFTGISRSNYQNKGGDRSTQLSQFDYFREQLRSEPSPPPAASHNLKKSYNNENNNNYNSNSKHSLSPQKDPLGVPRLIEGMKEKRPITAPGPSSVFDRLTDSNYYTGSQKIRAIEIKEKLKMMKKGTKE